LQETVVEELQDVVAHDTRENWSSSMFTVGVWDTYPKFNPEMVTMVPDDTAALKFVTLVASAASYVKKFTLVPNTPLTVRTDRPLLPLPEGF
jgi:hypothetical protein